MEQSDRLVRPQAVERPPERVRENEEDRPGECERVDAGRARSVEPGEEDEQRDAHEVEHDDDRLAQEVVDLHCPGAAQGPASAQGGEDLDAFHDPLRPARALGEEASEVRQRLLRHVRIAEVMIAVAQSEDVEPELVVLAELLPPWPASVGRQRIEHGQPGELPVAAHADGSGADAQQLHRGVRGAELDVLHPHEEAPHRVPQRAGRRARSPVRPVLHPDLELGGTDSRVAEAVRAGQQRQRIVGQEAVGIEDPDDRDVARPGRCADVVGDMGDSGVERIPLAGPRLRPDARDQVHPVIEVHQPAHDRGGAVVAVVVDHPDVRVREGHARRRDRRTDDALLVAARDEEMPVEKARIAFDR